MIKQVLTFSDTIHSVLATDSGLWIGHSGGLTGFDPGSGWARKWTTADGLPALPVLHIAALEDRLVVATPNGIAWTDDVRAHLRDAASDSRRPALQPGLMHSMGAGAYVNGVAFVNGKIYAATGGGRLYREGVAGFELLELPVRQARLVRLHQLPSGKRSLRLLVITNNSGVLLLATGAGEEPSLYQWSEDEGLCSRYVTATAAAGDYITVAVHGCVHVVARKRLVEAPEEITHWGKILWGDTTGSPEHNRIAALCEHADSLYIGTSVGLFRVPLSALEKAAREVVEAERIDDTPVRHLASFQGDLWVVQLAGLGRYQDAAASGSSRLEAHDAEGRLGSLRTRILGRRFGGRGNEPVAAAPTPVAWKRWRFIPEPHWRDASSEPELRQVLCLATSPEGLAAGGEAGRVALRLGARWQTEIVARLRRPPEVHALTYDPENATFWAATRYGLYQRDARGRWHRDLTFPGRTVHALSVWGGSAVALGSAGLHLFVQNEWTEIPFEGDTPALFVGAASEAALALAGRPGSPLYVWRAGASGPQPVSLSMGRANCMTWGPTGELWIGADRGLVRWDGKRTAEFVWNDEKRDHVTCLLSDARRLFVGSQAGVWVAPLEELRAASSEELESQGERLGLLQGLPDAHVTSMAWQDSGVWVGTAGGLVLLE